MMNLRNTSQKFDTSPVKPSKWFPNSVVCAQDDVWQNYAEFHASVLSGKQKGKYLVYDCISTDPKYECGGYGNRLHGITVLLMFAMFTKHVFLIQMTHPTDINMYLQPNAIQWNFTLPGELKSRYIDLFNKDNFYANFKTFESTLFSDDEYDVIRVRINFGLFYYLVTMSDLMISNLISTFNLKTQYDVVMLYGCAFNYLFKYQPSLIQAIKSLQAELGLETGRFVALHIRSHINDGLVFNPLHMKYPFKLMFKCGMMAAESLSHKLKLNVSKAPIYFATDHSFIREFAKEYYDKVLVFNKYPLFHVDHTKFKGSKANKEYDSGMLGVLCDMEISSRAGVLVRSADSSFSEVIGAIHFMKPHDNLHPFYFYEKFSLCQL